MSSILNVIESMIFNEANEHEEWRRVNGGRIWLYNEKNPRIDKTT
jgi:hypothetical protein